MSCNRNLPDTAGSRNHSAALPRLALRVNGNMDGNSINLSAKRRPAVSWCTCVYRVRAYRRRCHAESHTSVPHAATAAAPQQMADLRVTTNVKKKAVRKHTAYRRKTAPHTARGRATTQTRARWQTCATTRETHCARTTNERVSDNPTVRTHCRAHRGSLATCDDTTPQLAMK